MENVSQDDEPLTALKGKRFIHFEETPGYVLRIVCNELGHDITNAVYFALVGSHLRYGIQFWGFMSSQLFRSIFILQKRTAQGSTAGPYLSGREF